MKPYLQLLRTNPDFCRLWLAQAISLLGDWFNTLVLAALVAAYTDGSGLAISILLLCRFLPPILVAPFGGVLIDRFDRKRLLIISDVARVFIVLGLLFVSSSTGLWLIYLLTVLQFSMAAIFEPGRSAFLPTVVHPDDITTANVIGTMTWSVMLAAGGALGALVTGLLGTSTALVLDALTFALSALLIASVRARFTPAAVLTTSAEPLASASPSKMTAGFRFAQKHPPVLLALLIKAGGVLGSIDTLIIIYGTTLFVIGDKGAGSMGILWGAFGIGSIIGLPLFSRFNDGSIRQMRRLIIIAFMLLTVSWFIFGAAPSLLIASLALGIRAIGGSVYWTYSTIILQRLTPNDYLGRVFSLDWISWQASMVVSVIVTGIALEQFGEGSVRSVVYATGVISIAVLLLWIQAVRWLEVKERTAAVSTVPSPAASAD